MTVRERKVLEVYGTKMMTAYDKEGKFLHDAKEFLVALGNTKVIREANATVSGVADLLVCYNGLFIACELKKIGGKPSPQQLLFIKQIQNAGGSAGVCDCLADIWNLLCAARTAVLK